MSFQQLYACLSDVADNVKNIIELSEYDTENKGAYKGSLLTRLQSLTNGINGMIFSGKEINPENLFDENVIIDLSRVGSSETKSLLMGMLVLKLQEYRMATTTAFNNDLKHITVLEEAHNLLKRTSTEQPVEGGNLLGKSVEMLANAIAEMRTYGEGFIIADQAPGLLDLSVIRNTNTKIIMRLPDETDRMVVGKAANLNDDQISELAKLPVGVAAVYQNEWVQPVLCHIKKFDNPQTGFEYKREVVERANHDQDKLTIAKLLSNGTRLDKDVVLKEIRPKLVAMNLSSSVQVRIIKMLLNPPAVPRMTKIAPVVAELFSETLKGMKEVYSESSDSLALTEVANSALNDIYGNDIDLQVKRDLIQGLVTYFLLVKMQEIIRWDCSIM